MCHLQPTILHNREGSEEEKHTVQKEMLGCEMRKEAKISHFHSLNYEMLTKYKGKTYWSTSENYVQGRGSVVVKD